MANKKIRTQKKRGRGNNNNINFIVMKGGLKLDGKIC